MTFHKPSFGSRDVDTSRGPAPIPETDIWAVFRALRGARSVFGLRPGHIQTLQAMLSFLKPGQGETVFASNESICERVGGIDERTLRRHINRFVDLGFIKRQDSSNRKRYRIRASSGACISYGLSLAPFFARAAELVALATELENDRRDRVFVRKQILSRLAYLEEQDAANELIPDARKMLRRKLSLPEYRALLADVDVECADLGVFVDVSETTKPSVNNGQTVRHHSKSEKDRIDLKDQCTTNALSPSVVTSACDQAMSFSTKQLRSWNDVESHATTLAPMMGIHPQKFEDATKAVGAQKASCALFITLQLSQRVRNFNAYFTSLTLGQRREQFDPVALIKRFSRDATGFA